MTWRDFEVTLRLTVSKSVCMTWYRVSLWDLRPDIISCRNVAVWNLRACICGAPSLTKGWVCNLLRTRNHILLSHLRLFQPGGPGSRIYIPQEQGGPVEVEVEITLRQSVSQSVCLGIEHPCEIVMKHAQSGNMIRMDVKINATNLCNKRSPINQCIKMAVE
jgi:hypothetical protein